MTEDELRAIEAMYRRDVVGSDRHPENMMEYENRHRAHTRALIAEVRRLNQQLDEIVPAADKLHAAASADAAITISLKRALDAYVHARHLDRKGWTAGSA